MIQRNDGSTTRNMCWDEENRLVSVRYSADGEITPSQLSVYLYDAGGEKVWKLTGEEAIMDLSGERTVSLVNFNKTLYISPLMVMTEAKYTKHYFIEGERITSKIGSGFGVAPYMPADSVLDFIVGDDESVSGNLAKMVYDFVRCTNYSDKYSTGQELEPAGNDGSRLERLRYYYHPDHLGSSAFITNSTGSVVQHLQYHPLVKPSSTSEMHTAAAIRSLPRKGMMLRAIVTSAHGIMTLI